MSLPNQLYVRTARGMFRARLQAARVGGARRDDTCALRSLRLSLDIGNIIGAIAEPGNYDHATAEGKERGVRISRARKPRRARLHCRKLCASLTLIRQPISREPRALIIFWKSHVIKCTHTWVILIRDTGLHEILSRGGNLFYKVITVEIKNSLSTCHNI